MIKIENEKMLKELLAKYPPETPWMQDIDWDFISVDGNERVTYAIEEDGKIFWFDCYGNEEV